MTWTSAQKALRLIDNGFLGRDVRDLRMLARSLRDKVASSGVLFSPVGVHSF